MDKIKKIKLLLTVSELMHGSKTRQLTDLLKGLDQNLFDVEVGVSIIDNEASEDILKLGFPVKQIRMYPPRHPSLSNWIELLKAPFKLRNGKYDVVHSLHYSSFFLEGLLVKFFSKGAKYIYSKSNPEWNNHPTFWYLKSMLADVVIVGSTLLEDLLIANGFGRKIVKIFYGIDTDFFQKIVKSEKIAIRNSLKIRENFFIFGCASQFLMWKNHQALVRAFSIVALQHEHVKLLLCGQVSDKKCFAEVMSLISERNLEDKVEILGTLHDMRHFYGAIDCFVLPSINEAFGLVYIEAMSSGIPVIACAMGGPKDIIVNGINGFTVTFDNCEQELADRMNIYVENNSLAEEHGGEGRVRVQKYFSKEGHVSEHAKLYRALVGV